VNCQQEFRLMGMTGNFAKNWKMWQKYLQKFGKDELQLNFEKMIH
jgi:hypothetical protein